MCALQEKREQNEILKKMDSIQHLQVFAKVRSLQQGEATDSSLQVRQKSVITGQQSCEFVEVFYGDETPQRVLRHPQLNKLLEKCLQGYNSCLLIFGESGSGQDEFVSGSSRPGAESLAGAVSSFLFSAAHLAVPVQEGSGGTGSARHSTAQSLCVALKGFEVVGTSLRDLSTLQPVTMETYGFPGARVKGLSSTTVASSSEAIAQFQQMWSRRTRGSQGIDQTLPLSTQVIVFDLLNLLQGQTAPMLSSFSVVLLPGAENMAESLQSTRLPSVPSSSSSLSHVRALGHLVHKLAQGQHTGCTLEDTPLNLIMGNYLASNCITGVLVTLRPTVSAGSAVNRVLLHAQYMRGIVNFPVRNSPAVLAMLKAVEERFHSLCKERGHLSGQTSGSRQSTMLSDGGGGGGGGGEESVQSLLAANQALRDENTRLKLQLLKRVGSRQGMESADSSAGSSTSRQVQSLSAIPRQSTPVPSSGGRGWGHQDWHQSESLTLLLDREHIVSRELQRLRSLVAALEEEKQAMQRERSELKLQVLKLSSREESLQGAMAEVKSRCLQLQASGRGSEPSALDVSRQTAVDLQLEKTQQDVRIAEENLRQADKCNHMLYQQLKRLNRDYQQRLEQYIHDVTAYLRAPPSPALPCQHLYAVLELVDDLTRSCLESGREDLQHSEASLQLTAGREHALLERVSELSCHIDTVYQTLRQSSGSSLKQALTNLPPPPAHSGLQAAAQPRGVGLSRCPSGARQQGGAEEVLREVNRSIPVLVLAMQAGDPSLEADLRGLVEGLLQLKLSLLKHSLEARCGSLQSGNSSNAEQLLQGLTESLKEAQREKVALKIKTELLQAELKELKRRVGLT